MHIKYSGWKRLCVNPWLIVVYAMQDRYAVGRFLPPIDTVSQDWFLTNSEEEDGFTLLEFSRNFTSCDPQDLDITVRTCSCCS